MTFETATFDVIYSRDALMHIHDKPGLFDKFFVSFLVCLNIKNTDLFTKNAYNDSLLEMAQTWWYSVLYRLLQWRKAKQGTKLFEILE